MHENVLGAQDAIAGLPDAPGEGARLVLLESVIFTHLREAEQYDDLTILAVRKK